MNKKQLRILIAPLDWGLGHVTRCLPIINYILSSGHMAIFAGNDSQKEYVKNIYPKIQFLHLEGYNVAYAKSRLGLVPKILIQVPRLRNRIKKENLWLKQIILSEKIDAVISDNRYGLYNDQIPCVVLTHQLQIRSGISHYLDRILRKMHYRFLEKFSECWVVDTLHNSGLSGVLGHPETMPKIKTSYLGLLSQCAGSAGTAKDPSDFYVLILLSGAEPQRSILADALWKKAIKSDKHIIFVAGNERAATPANIPEHISFHKRLSANDLILAINAASIVICRSGYSSLMDLIALNKKAILIPTPGQTEQEYLAKQMHEKRIFMSAQQHKFDIQTSLLNASLFPFEENKFSDCFSEHKKILDQFFIEVQGAKRG